MKITKPRKNSSPATKLFNAMSSKSDSQEGERDDNLEQHGKYFIEKYLTPHSAQSLRSPIMSPLIIPPNLEKMN